MGTTLSKEVTTSCTLTSSNSISPAAAGSRGSLAAPGISIAVHHAGLQTLRRLAMPFPNVPSISGWRDARVATLRIRSV